MGPLALTDDIIAFENGDLDEDAVVALFQKLLDTGMIYHLQGHYQRTMQGLLDQGLVVPKRNT